MIVLEICSLKKKNSKREKFCQDANIRLKQAKKILWFKRKTFVEEKTKNVNDLIIEMLENEKKTKKNEEIISEIYDFVKKNKETHDISEIPDHFLCKINYVCVLTQFSKFFY